MNDTIFYGGTILTMAGKADPRDDAGPTAVAVRDGRIAAVGSDEEALSLRRDGTTLVALQGRTVCPGFIDAHHHFTLAAWCQLGIDLSGCRSAAEAIERIRRRAATAPGDSWLYGYNYAPRRFAHGPALTRHHLDAAAGERPVVAMHFSYHEAVVSSAGLRLAGIDRATPDPLGGRIVRDRSGEPTGELLETAAGPVEALARTAGASLHYEDWVTAAARYAAGLLAAGITHVCDPGIDAMLEGYLRRASDEGRLPLPVSMLLVAARGGLFRPPEDRLEGPTTGAVLDGLPVGGLKLFADGGSRCAVCTGLLESFAGVAALAGRAVRLRRPALLRDASAPERPRLGRDGRLRLGYLHYAPGQLAALCARAQANGFGVAVHAACNAAIDGVLAAYERLPAGAHRHRVEHLVSLDAQQARRLAATGAIGVVQPAYIGELGDEWEAMPTPPRLHSVPLRLLLDAGVALAGSSDAPVAPYAPLRGMHAAVTRRTDAGLQHQPDQAITPWEALHLWTGGAALATHQEGQRGVLRPGAAADLVVLSHNPLATPPERFDTIRVEQTVIGGATVFEAARRVTSDQ